MASLYAGPRPRATRPGVWSGGYTAPDRPPIIAAMGFAAPIEIDSGETVRREWIDYNDHMNVAYYLLAFDQALDRLYDRIGLGEDYLARTNHSTMTMETHITYLRELRLGAPIRFTFQLLDYDNRRQHFFGRMFHAAEGYLAATHEWLTTHVDLAARRSAELPAAKVALFAEMMTEHAALPRPEQAGAVIGIRRK
jgi:acyl-CoA thioester hydrolase